MILDSATRKLSVVLGEAKTTTDCDVTASWVRGVREERVSGQQLARTNGVTVVDVLGAPPNGYWYEIQEMTVANLDTVTHVVKILLIDGANTYVVHKCSLTAGQNLTYNAVEGFTVN